MMYNVQELEELLRNNRIENAAHKKALWQRLFGSAGEISPAALSEGSPAGSNAAYRGANAARGTADAELSVEELAMAAGGINAEILREEPDKIL